MLGDTHPHYWSNRALQSTPPRWTSRKSLWDGWSLGRDFTSPKCFFSGPRRSMYAVYAYIDPPNHPNVGKYGIHGVPGGELGGHRGSFCF